MSLGTIDSPSMRKLIKILVKTNLSIPLVLLLKGIIERMGDGFKFRKLNMVAVGQSHLDAAWRWRKKQTILKARATFSKAIKHMREYPGFTFAQTSPAYYVWMKEHFPKLYAEIKHAVKAGKWLLMGGMWVEPDLNMPSGEALVRQRLYGMRFYQDEFGKMPDIEFCQDTFGFCWSLPQILAKSRARMFGTGKIFWNDTNDFPIGMFHWKSPDGTLLPTLLMHFGYFLPINYGKRYKDIYRLIKGKTKPGIDPVFDYSTPLKQIRLAQSKELMLDTVFGYGLGDGGHGPIELEMMAVSAFRLLFPKRFKYCEEGDFYNQFVSHFDRWATWNSELYLELHRGVYTTNSRAKSYNRQLEILLEESEKACVIAALLGTHYPRDQLSDCWKTVLFNQFHDILPGSSIFEVYRDAFEEYERVKEILNGIMQSALSTIGNAVVSSGKPGSKVLMAYNSLTWQRKNLIEIPRDLLESIDNSNFLNGVKDIIQITSAGTYLVPIEVPTTSVTIISPDSTKNAMQKIKQSSNKLRVEEREEDILMENDKVSCNINKKTGYLTSVLNKETCVEGLASPANRILLFHDEPRSSHAWEIDKDYLKKPITVDDNCKSIQVIERGPLRCGVEVVHVHDKSTFTQRVYLEAGDNLVRCSMDVDWHQQRTLLKIAFPVSTAKENVVSDIPYACIPRPIVPRTDREKARWEYNCQKWIDVSDGDAGVGIVNSCKYGFSMAGNEIRLTVLNSPDYAGYAKETMFVDRDDKTIPIFVDQFHHKDIRYALYIHPGDWREDIWRKAIEFNIPVSAHVVKIKENAQKSNLVDASRGFMTCSPENIVVTSIKVHEDEVNLDKPTMFIVRVVEMAGKGPVEACIEISGKVKVIQAEHVDLLEMRDENARKVSISGNNIRLTIGPHEIATIRVQVAQE